MARLSIAITTEESHKLKAIAAHNVQSMKDDVLGWTFGEVPAPKCMSEMETLSGLTDFWTVHVGQSHRGELSPKSVIDIKSAAYERGARNMNAYDPTLAAVEDLRSI
ncbi:MAG: hypothetical protein OXE84_08025 [Rhodobacteraceae bacterium]|nr:hypothetical protein [Paracoccaceae bacterium]MCY4196893.1 hypothetical protein [Paracoccaceae bacterium]MCY4328148.1 hypothetical protein [Paracoccaceae bacterium]